MSVTETLYVVDTNALLNNPHFILGKKVVIPIIVLEELQTLERKKDYKVLQYQIREAKRVINGALESEEENIHVVSVEGFRKEIADDTILAVTENIIDHEQWGYVVLVTDDILMKIKAEEYKIPTRSVYDKKERENRTGVLEIYYRHDNESDKESLAKTYDMLNRPDYYYNPFDMHENQYLVVWDKNSEKIIDGEAYYDPVETFRFNGTSLERVKYKYVKNEFDKVKPINVRQRFAFDLMQNREIPVKLLTGNFGTG